MNQQKPSRLQAFIVSAVLGLNVLQAAPAQASLFNTAHYLAPKEYTLGAEPEVVLGTPSGAGINFRYMMGVNDMSNAILIAGIGSGPRQLRLGGAYTFDLYPDTSGQPGVGIALQGLFVQIPNALSAELSAAPYIHKNFASGDVSYEPFLGVPLNLGLSNGLYATSLSVVPGVMMHHSKNFSTALEVGVNLASGNIYMSGGVIYNH